MKAERVLEVATETALEVAVDKVSEVERRVLEVDGDLVSEVVKFLVVA